MERGPTLEADISSEITDPIDVLGTSQDLHSRGGHRWVQQEEQQEGHGRIERQR